MWAGQRRGVLNITILCSPSHYEDQVLTNSHYNENLGPGHPQHGPTRLDRVGWEIKNYCQDPYPNHSWQDLKLQSNVINLLYFLFLITIKNIKSRMICFCSGCIYSSSDVAVVTVADHSCHTSSNPSAISSRSQSCYCNSESSS